MQMTYCDNCGCSIDNDQEISSIVVTHPYYEVSAGIKTLKSETRSYILCPCCAVGLIQVLDRNRTQLSNMHGENCCDILPYGVRCSHKHTGRVPCTCNPNSLTSSSSDCSCGAASSSYSGVGVTAVGGGCC